jgi:hypothetical protein
LLRKPRFRPLEWLVQRYKEALGAGGNVLNQVLTNMIWREVARRARSAPTRKAAIAYVTTDEIGLRAGDVLITDASERAIRSGQTDAKLLRKLHGGGVNIYNREGLHSKVALFGNHAIVGSANMSASNLIETSVITDNPVIPSGVAAFIEMLSTKRSRLGAARIAELCAIKVIRRGRPKGRRKANPVRQIGNSTWIVSVRELKRNPSDQQQKRIDRRNQELNERLGKNEDFGWIQWSKKSRFGRECRAGDTLIEIFQRLDRKYPFVTRRVRVLLRDPEPDLVRFYTQEVADRSNEVGWSRFQRILKKSNLRGRSQARGRGNLILIWLRLLIASGQGSVRGATERAVFVPFSDVPRCPSWVRRVRQSGH